MDRRELLAHTGLVLLGGVVGGITGAVAQGAVEHRMRTRNELDVLISPILTDDGTAIYEQLIDNNGNVTERSVEGEVFSMGRT